MTLNNIEQLVCWKKNLQLLRFNLKTYGCQPKPLNKIELQPNGSLSTTIWCPRSSRVTVFKLFMRDFVINGRIVGQLMLGRWTNQP